MNKEDFDFPNNSVKTRYIQFIANYLTTLQVDVYNLPHDQYSNQTTKTKVLLLYYHLH